MPFSAYASLVYDRFAELYQSPFWMADFLTKSDLIGAQKGSTINLPELPSYTISDASTGGAVADATLNALGVTGNVLSIDQDKLLPIEIGEFQDAQIASNPALVSLVAENAALQMRAGIDRYLFNTAITAAYDTSGTYVDNKSATGPAALTQQLALSGVGKVQRAGAQFPNMALFVPFEARPQFEGLATWSREAGNSALGVGGPLMNPNMIGNIAGIPVISSSGIPYRRTVACTAVSISSNVATVTAAGHQLTTGDKVTIAGITVPLTVAASVTVTSSSEFTVALTTGDGAMADGAGTITLEGMECLLVDRANCHAAFSRFPSVKVVDGGAQRASEVVKVHALYGGSFRTGNVRVLKLAL